MEDINVTIEKLRDQVSYWRHLVKDRDKLRKRKRGEIAKLRSLLAAVLWHAESKLPGTLVAAIKDEGIEPKEEKP